MPRSYQSKTPQQLIKDGSVMTYKEYLEACSRQYHIRKDLKEYGIQPKNFSGVKFEELMAAINELKEATNMEVRTSDEKYSQMAFSTPNGIGALPQRL